jgi:hypothetical protein
MNELFGSLLDMTKLDADIVQPSPTALPVQRLLDRIETTFAEEARRKGLRLRVVASGAWGTSDPILLERIFLNLVSNAVRYTEQGGVVVGCRRRGASLRIEVCDTGPGIPEDQRRSIFGEFYQLARSNAGRREGLGLGLAIVDRLCRLLGHQVQVDSEPGRGSRFAVTVPLAAEPPTATEVPAQAPAIADPARGKLVIVIDDDALVLDGMRGILQGWAARSRPQPQAMPHSPASRRTAPDPTSSSPIGGWPTARPASTPSPACAPRRAHPSPPSSSPATLRPSACARPAPPASPCCTSGLSHGAANHAEPAVEGVGRIRAKPVIRRCIREAADYG